MGLPGLTRFRKCWKCWHGWLAWGKQAKGLLCAYHQPPPSQCAPNSPQEEVLGRWGLQLAGATPVKGGASFPFGLVCLTTWQPRSSGWWSAPRGGWFTSKAGGLLGIFVIVPVLQVIWTKELVLLRNKPHNFSQRPREHKGVSPCRLQLLGVWCQTLSLHLEELKRNFWF